MDKSNITPEQIRVLRALQTVLVANKEEILNLIPSRYRFIGVFVITFILPALMQSVNAIALRRELEEKRSKNLEKKEQAIMK